jgi:large subunit ribosomal protein L21
MRYAVLNAGGKQVMAREGETIEVDRLARQPGETVEFREVLLVADGPEIRIGSPTVPDVLVQGTVVEHFRGPKVTVFKYIPKERYRRKQGHRQGYTRISIRRIVMPGADAAEEGAEAPAAPRRKAARPAAKSAAKTARRTPAAKRAAPASPATKRTTKKGKK